MWIIIGIIHFYFLENYYKLSFNFSLAESLINSFILCILNFGLWYFLKFSRIEEKSFIQLFINSLGAGIFVISSWILVSWAIMVFITGNNTFFTEVFLKSLVLKIIIGTAIYFFTLLIYYLIIYYQNYKENLIRKNELTTLLKEEELTNLKQQINPHFLFNSLNSISYLIFSNPDNAHESIIKLSDYFRYSLSIAKNQFTTVKDELENITRYLEIEKIRFDDKMLIKKEIEDICLNHQIPVMILQPLAENAVKHGVYESTEKVIIEIQILDFEDYFQISFKNNFDIDAKPRKGTGLGLKNINQRLKLIYKREDLVKISKTDNTFEIKILFPKTI